MSLANTTVQALYSANGSNVDFAIPFTPIIDDSAETLVYVRDESTDPATETLQTEGALNDYTLIGAPTANDFHTTVRFNTAPANGLIVLVIRQLPRTQTLDLQPSGAFQPASQESALDRLAAMVQELNQKIRRALLKPITTSELDDVMPEFSGKGDYVLTINTAGTEVELKTADDVVASAANGFVSSLTGDVTGTGPGATATTIANSAVTTAKILDANVTNSKLADMAQSTIKGRAVGAGTGAPTDLTATQATAILNDMVGDSGSGGTKGLVPAPAAGDAAASKFLKADGTWTVVAASGMDWTVPVDADVVPDGDGTRSLGNGTNRFATVHTDAVDSAEFFINSTETAWWWGSAGISFMMKNGTVNNIAYYGSEDAAAAGDTTGDVLVQTGTNVGNGGASVNTGGMYVTTGYADGTSNTGPLEFYTGGKDAASTSGDTGTITFNSGSVAGGTGSSGGIMFNVGSSVGASSSGISFNGGAALTNTGDFDFITGPATNGNSGGFTFLVGTAGGTQGQFKFLKTGVASVIGDVWTATGTSGEGYWAASTGITALTGDVTASGPGSAAATIANDAVTNAKLADMAAWTFKIRNNAASGDASDAALADFTAATPVAADYVVGFKSTGEVRKFDVATLLAGGGGGGAIRWIESANAPVLTFENEIDVYEFTPALSQELYTSFRVPSSYIAGTQIFLKILWYCASTSGNALLVSRSTLIRSEVDGISSTTDQRTSTNSAITMSATNDLEPQKISLDLTDAFGDINGTAVSAGDLIKIKLYESSSTCADGIKFIFDATEVST
jgi:hypothetical protein